MNLQTETETPAEVSLDWESLSNRCLGRLDLVERALARFQEGLGDDLTQLEQAIGASDEQEWARLAHRIKGTSLTVSATRLSRCALELERKTGTDSAEVEQSLNEIREECDRLHVVIDHYLRGQNR